MKVIIIALCIICFSNHLFSKTTDSLALNVNTMKNNEFGLSANSMNNIVSANYNIINSISLIYKRRFTNYALRVNFYNYEKDNNNYFNDYKKLRDSTFIISSYNLNTFYTGAKIGFEKDYSLNNKLILFYGIDVLYTHIKEEHIISSTYLKINSSDLINVGMSGTYAPYETLYGYEIGINPIIGIEQFFEPFFSATVEVNFLSYYTMMQHHTYSTVLDEKVKLIVNYSF